MKYFQKVTVDEFKKYLLTFSKIKPCNEFKLERIEYKDVDNKLIAYTKLRDLTYWILDK